MTTIKAARHWIGGRWLDSAEHGDSIDPATGTVIGRYAKGGRAEAELAVNAARRTLTCASTPLILTDYGRAAEVDADSLSIVIRQPVGLAGIFAPWNAPIALGIRSLAPALAAGCTAAMILPPETAQVNAVIGEVIADTDGLPPGVANILTGGREGLDLLVEPPDVPVISFTGSTRTGRAISAAGAARLKRFGLELGGKVPMVVFDDADAAVTGVAAGLIVFAGQRCMTGSRAIVQRGIAERFRTALAERLRTVRVGPASDPRSAMSPLINTANVERVNTLVEDAIAAGREKRRARRPRDGRAAGARRLLRADASRGDGPEPADRAAGGVRAGADDAGLRHGSRSGVAGQRQRVRPGRERVVVRRGPAAARRARSKPGRSDQRLGHGCTTSSRRVASSRSAGAACGGRLGSTTFWRSNTSPSSQDRSGGERTRRTP